MKENAVISAGYCESGISALEDGDIELAIAAFCLAVEADSENSAAFSGLGLALLSRKEWEKAEGCLRKAIELEPEQAEFYNNLALVFMEKKRFEDAEACLLIALEHEPCCAAVHNNLALVLEENERFEAAEAHYREAVSLQGDYAEALYNLGNLLKAKLDFKEAEIFLRRAVNARGGYDEAIFSLAVLQLTQGRFREGWPQYDAWRMKRPAARRDPKSLRWQGESLAGKNILLYHEQGFGDNLQFLRYLPLVDALAENVKVWLQPELSGLFSCCYPQYDLHEGKLPPEEHFDFSCPIPSLPAVFLSDEATAPKEMPYLWAEEELKEIWRKKIAAQAGKMKVGLVWAGNPGHNNDHNRSLSFCLLEELLACPQVEWHSLQVGLKSAEAKGTQIKDWSSQLVDFAQTAALLSNLDLLLCVDSAVAHLAGALNRPTWMLVPFLPDWRWQLEREDSYWYPSLRLFRQSERGDWPGVLKRVKKALMEESEKYCKGSIDI